MHIYVLDELLRRTALIDQYESLIWTERYSEKGDFELVVRSDTGMRALLPEGALLSIEPLSKRVMKVETVSKDRNDDGVAVLTVTGPSTEQVLDERVAMGSVTDLETVPKWILTGTPGDIARYIFQRICVDGILSPLDPIPFYQPGSVLPAGSIAEPLDPITVALDPDTVYNSIKKICDQYDLGFRLVRDETTAALYFDVYTGHDRTTLQSDYAAVVFSPELDNLANTKEYTSSEGYKNVAYVYGKFLAEYVYPDGIPAGSVQGLERRVLMVKAEDIELDTEGIETPDEIESGAVEFTDKLTAIDPDTIAAAVLAFRQDYTGTTDVNVAAAQFQDQLYAGDAASIVLAGGRYRTMHTQLREAQLTAAYSDYRAALIQRGKESLAEHRPVIAFDGEIPQTGSYIYGVHYNLGDLVESRDADGIATNMRVTEQIFVSDAEGVRSYPTLTIYRLITPGSWLSWDASQVWSDADGTWSEA